MKACRYSTATSPFKPSIVQVIIVLWALLAWMLPASAYAKPDQTTPGIPQAEFTPCPLGDTDCASHPPEYLLCHASALMPFYDPDLPRDSQGRQDALTHIRAEKADASATDLYHFTGDASLTRYDQRLTADQINYNDKTTAYDARGHVTWQDSSLLLSAKRIHGNTRHDQTQASDVTYQLLTSRGNGKATQVEARDQAHHQFHQVTYSTCDINQRMWEIRANKITTDKNTGEGKAQGATLRLGHVPVMYFPYFSFPIDNRRKTGFLYPTFINKGHDGFVLSVPYYLNLAPNYDATLIPQIYTQRGLLMGGQFRYLFGASTGQFDVDYMPNDRRSGKPDDHHPRHLENGKDRYMWQFSDHTKLGGNWRLNTNLERASDKYYFQDFRSRIAGYTTPSSLHSNATLTNSGKWWQASISVDYYQNVDPEYTDTSLPYRRWPRAIFRVDKSLSHNWSVGIDSNWNAFRRDNSVEGNRLDAAPWIQADFRRAAWYVKPRLAWRYTHYHITNDPGNDNYQRDDTRSLPVTSIDSGLMFERSISLFGTSYRQTLEPRLYYLYVPYRDQHDLPRFDTSKMNFAWWQLFTTNNFSGADRQMNANNLTTAITTRFLNDSGKEKAAFGLGQIHYFSPQKVQLTNGTPMQYDKHSSYVASLSVNPSPSWRLTSAYQWNPNTRHNEVGTLQIQHRLNNDGILNFGYHYRNRYTEQFDTSAIIPINARWRMLARWNYQLRDRASSPNWNRNQAQTLSALLGVQYESCCVAVSLLGRHYIRNVYGETDNAVMLQIKLKGLGSFNPQAEQLLHHAILGYQ